jgi:hypothetical protein
MKALLRLAAAATAPPTFACKPADDVRVEVVTALN